MSFIVYKDDAKTTPGLPDLPTEDTWHDWTLEPGKRLLKGRKDAVAVGQEEYGLTSEDLEDAQVKAWYMVLLRLLSRYDVSGWSSNTPEPLFEIWDYLGSAQVIRMVAQRYNVDEESAAETPTTWENKAESILLRIIEPKNEPERIHLVRQSTGEVIRCRLKANLPVVGGQNPMFFPRLSTTTSFGIDSWETAERIYKTLNLDGSWPKTSSVLS